MHSRAQATALLLLMLVDVLDRKLWRAPVWICLAALLHIQMAFYAILLAIFFLFPERWLPAKIRTADAGAFALLLAFPLATLFEKGSDAWLEAARSRSSHYLLRWEWYEWLGIFGPMIFFWWYTPIGGLQNFPLPPSLSRLSFLFLV